MEASYQNGSGGVNGSNGMSRAEKFEDEKRKIIESCFAKRDEDGSVMESYITHCRITEDPAYPSSPPPPTSTNKKPRLIIVAVRKSGRVRMHKARENLNGTYSIGKSWQLDDLTAVQSFNGAVPRNPEEEQQKAWAGGVGFIVTIGKPYYWAANTQKEKQFFIASLYKIYTKYTGGRSPEMIGFDQKEMDQLQGVATRSLPPSQTSSPAGPGIASPFNRPPRREVSRDPPLRRQSSREAMQRQISPSGASSFTSQTPRPQALARREDSPSGSFDSDRPLIQNQNLRRLAGNNQSQESFARSEDSGSLPPRSRAGMAGLPSAPGRFQDRSVTPSSQRATTPDSNFSGGRETASEVPPVPAPLTYPPERRRPPMPVIGDSRQRGDSSDNIVPAPLASPGMRRDDLRPPVRSSERNQPRDLSSDSSSPIGNGASPVEPSRKMSQDTPNRNGATQSPSIASVMTPLSATIVPAVKLPEEEKFEEDTRPGYGPMIKIRSAVTSPVSPNAEEKIGDTRPGLGPMIKNRSAVSSPVSPETPDTPDDNDPRPGLGPMIRKKKSKIDVANTFLKAASSANSFNTFKPRAGGAAERLREARAREAEKSADGPDGITGVVPAPSLLRKMSTDTTSNVTIPVEKPTLRKTNDSLPEVKITVPASDRPSSVEGPMQQPQEDPLPEKSKVKEPKRTKPASETMQKELIFLGVDPSILGGRGHDLVAAWDEFGWVGEGVHTKNIDQMKDEIERELNKVQAGGWLTRLDEEDERIAAIQSGLDKCIDECDQLDGLLTLYLVELSTRNEDIAYIEAQSQGLQVQAANQKLLEAELRSLLDTISISSDQLGCLREASIESTRGLEQIETALVTLYKAMLTINPSLSTSGPRASLDGSLSSGRQGGFGSSELGSMRVMQEKKDVYRNESAQFLSRLKPFLQVKFAAAIDETRKALEREKASNLTRGGKIKLDPRNHDLSRDVLWKYGPLMLFAREVDRPEWEDCKKAYEMVARPLYQDEFRDAFTAWRRIARKPTGDEGDILFTSQLEKQTEGLATTARKLTVKRSQTLAKSLRSPIGDNGSKVSLDRGPDGRLQPFEVFAQILDEAIPIMTMEQNFVVEFFHVSSHEQHDFPEAVAAAPPNLRHGSDLRRTKVMDPNRDLAKRVIISMEEIYSFFEPEMQSLVEWCLQADPLQGIGLMAAIERKVIDFEESNQEFLARTFHKLHQRLVGLFNKFLDDQIRAIEETKVKIKKRKGVIGFVRIFPSFSLAVETMLTSAEELDIREIVNLAYGRINKAMFESLKVIARENPSAQTAGTDPEDKEALNYQILLIENMNHYVEEVDTRSNPVLEDWKQTAEQEMREHLDLYLGAVIRRPLGKLLDYLESTEALIFSRQPGEPASRISSMPSHSKTTFKKVLSSYDSKEIKKGIEVLKKRVEKHFGDADDPGLSRGLVTKVQQECEQVYEKVEDRILTISRDVYDGDAIAEWTRADVSGAFRK